LETVERLADAEDGLSHVGRWAVEQVKGIFQTMLKGRLVGGDYYGGYLLELQVVESDGADVVFGVHDVIRVATASSPSV
jgi:hypothetical protein